MKYNVITVLADQHKADWMGCADHKQALTPNLDAFASEGVRFRNAYTQNTVCTPSRMSIMTGQYCHNHGYFGLHGPANFSIDNIFRHFRKFGYRTGAFGKLHMPNSPRNYLADDLDCCDDSYETPDGRYNCSEYLKMLEAKNMRHLEDSWYNVDHYMGKIKSPHDASVSDLPYELTQEMYATSKAIEFIEQSGEAPFCVNISYQRPHYQLHPQKRFWDLYDEDIELPETFYLSNAHRNPAFQETAWDHNSPLEFRYAAEGENPEEGFRRIWRGTLACVSQIDDVFGRLIQFLKDKNLYDNTIIVYGADHGAYHSEYAIHEKAPGICSSAVCKVPFIWHVPEGLAGVFRDELVENIDINSTVTSLCDLEPMNSVDGKDISSLLKDRDSGEVRNVAVTENVWSKSIRFGQYRLVHYNIKTFDNEDTGELYDVDNDPLECENLYYKSEYQEIVAEARRLLLDWLIETTRCVTCMPTYKLPNIRDSLCERHEFPIAGDGKALNAHQMINREDKNLNYI
jgi:arylsulfatase A-like enzyme